MAALEKLAFRLYEILPRRMVNVIGKSSLLKPIRDMVLRKGKTYREINVRIKREYLDYQVDFQFIAALKGAEKAKNKGVENTLLRDSLRLLREAGITEKAHIFDIGANYGYLSLVWASTVCQKGGKVFAFEPNPHVVAAFRNSIKINGLADTIFSENVAVGRLNGKTELFLRSTTSNTIKSSESESSIVVELICIDDYVKNGRVQRCDLIKIDVDGSEYEILQGANKTIDRFSPILIIETNQDKRIVQFLIDKGYAVKDMHLNPIYIDSKLPSNIICFKTRK